MNRCSFLRWAAVFGIGLSFAVAESAAQTSASAEVPRGTAALTKLFQPVYPPLARQSHITGDVVLLLGIRQDGTVESVVVESGQPLLKQAALDSAQKSQFECRNCNGAVTSYRMVYTFQLIEPTKLCCATDGSCNDKQADPPVPGVVQLENHVTVIDRAVDCCCPDVSPAKFRALKCLYLWKCGLHHLI
jgi:TonB family protein